MPATIRPAFRSSNGSCHRCGEKLSLSGACACPVCACGSTSHAPGSCSYCRQSVAEHLARQKVGVCSICGEAELAAPYMLECSECGREVCEAHRETDYDGEKQSVRCVECLPVRREPVSGLSRWERAEAFDIAEEERERIERRFGDIE